MTPDHAAFLAELRMLARAIRPEPPRNDAHGGGGHPFYNVSAHADAVASYLAEATGTKSGRSRSAAAGA